MRSFWLHGWATDSRVFGPLGAALPDRISRGMIAPNLAVILNGIEPAAWGVALAAWVRKESPPGTPVLLAGWSMGAMLALEVAAILGKATSGLILISGCARFIGDAETPEGQPDRVLRLMQRRLADSPHRALEEFFDAMHAPGEDTRRNSFRRDWLPLFRDQNQAWLERGIEYLRKSDCRPLTAGIVSPALVLHGEKDSVIHHGIGAELARRLPRGKIVTLAGGDHVPLTGRSDRIVRPIVSFIEGLSDPEETA